MNNESGVTECDQISRHEIDMEILISQLEEYLDLYELVKYQITENFPKLGLRTYGLHNLEAEVEFIDGKRSVTFKDIEGVLEEDYTRTLNHFDLDLVQSVIHEHIDGVWRAFIMFNDGTIIIERENFKYKTN